MVPRLVPVQFPHVLAADMAPRERLHVAVPKQATSISKPQHNKTVFTHTHTHTPLYTRGRIVAQ